MVDLKAAVKAGTSFLLSRVESGLCPEFGDQLRHGASQAWTSACIGSTLSEVGIISTDVLDALLSMQWSGGGWSYNQGVSPDADSTLRALQFLNKIGFKDSSVISQAELFVAAHQQVDGGIATFLPDLLSQMGYPEGGWTISHPCVTALAINVLPDGKVRSKAVEYLASRARAGDARSYWWRTQWYFRYEFGWINGDPVGSDPVELGLVLLTKAKLGLADAAATAELSKLQLADGSFPASHQFRIPRPHQNLDDFTGDEEVVVDNTRILSTAAAMIAIYRGPFK